MLTRRGLLRAVDGSRVRTAIEAAERRTSGEIRVSVAPYFWGNVRRVAERAFDRLGMTATRERNGVLFFIVPARRRFVVLGDAGIHAKVGQEFWDKVAAAISERFHEGDYTGGLEAGIGAVGEQLATHFPFEAATDVNELPDDVEFGRQVHSGTANAPDEAGRSMRDSKTQVIAGGLSIAAPFAGFAVCRILPFVIHDPWGAGLFAVAVVVMLAAWGCGLALAAVAIMSRADPPPVGRLLGVLGFVVNVATLMFGLGYLYAKGLRIG
jgi:uncharacterized membrane protein YgcG